MPFYCVVSGCRTGYKDVGRNTGKKLNSFQVMRSSLTQRTSASKGSKMETQ